MSTFEWLGDEISPEDIKYLEEAVAKAELKTSAEIVPMLVKSSVPKFIWVLFAVLYAAIVQYIYLLASGFSSFEFLRGHSFELSVLPASFLVFYVLLLRFNTIKKLLVPYYLKEYFVLRRAESEFWQLRMWKTKDATGVLYFVSLEEHISVILADEAIDKKVVDGSWDGILKLSLQAIRKKGLKEGIALAVSQISDLIQSDFPIQKDDIDELPNRLVIKE